jgi:cytochrome P450
MATRVNELDLPEVDLFGLDRSESLDVLQEAGRQHWLARNAFGYVVSRYDDVVAVLRERRFHSALSLIPTMQGIEVDPLAREQPSILSMEGAEHTRVRRLASPAFTPRAADRLRPFMREVVTGLVDEVASTGECDLVTDICEPYPIPIICELLGAPKEDWKLFSAWATDIFRIFNSDLLNDAEHIRRASSELDAYVHGLIAERRADPRDDLLSALIAAEEEGDRLSSGELAMMAQAVLMAGTDTTRNQLACAVALFTEHPDQWAMLREQPDLAAGAVEECMRVLGAVRGTARFASEDIEYRDVLFPTGTLLNVGLAAANVDEDIWPDPRRFDITRESSSHSHMSFGSGTHYCLGASLARAELQEALTILAARLPDLALGGPIEWKPLTVGIWGPAALPLRFTPS